ncbi:MAG: hypothetical protein A2289_05155 [Deltaproteobacteria bacterium RIFOXYA12_FULL_58_15]|nr:MAG: hypothetical protein A2289_05155 [Deltaproteobacteria bacterium RIFOXYA12_FULL_58_15]OGR08564.1 MAG: hypothetical protein A2341_25490 [Deltaproteobacteria bacterium RIFOXYB12_FULL_58_9]
MGDQPDTNELPETYNFVLVLDDPRRGFDVAAAAIREIRERYEPHELLNFDFFYAPGSPLACLARFDWAMFGPDLPVEMERTAQKGHFRLLEPMQLSAVERRSFVERLNARLACRHRCVTSPGAALSELRRTIMGEPKVELGAVDPNAILHLRVQFASPEEFLDAYATTPLGRGIFIPSEALPEVGQAIKLTIETASGQGPICLSGRVVYVRDQTVARSQKSKMGFGVGFLLPPTEQNMFESFQNAVRRGAPWPERSGRRYERFPIPLRVEYEINGEARREHTVNLSRGGMFIDSFDPPPVGSIINFDVFATGSKEKANLAGTVVRSVDVNTATREGGHCGAGIRFMESPIDVLSRLSHILSSVDIPFTRRALLADDDRFFRTVIGNILRLGGFQILEAADGDAAFNLLLEELLDLDVLLLDLVMPGISGPDLVDKIRRVGGETDLKIVFLTATSVSDVEHRKLLEYGASDVLHKSLSPEEVLLRIEACLEKE